MQVSCLICDKSLEMTEQELVMDGGFIYIEFHYGSRHDQCKGFENYLLINLDQIEAYICDDCFEKKKDKIRRFKLNKTIERIEVTKE